MTTIMRIVIAIALMAGGLSSAAADWANLGGSGRSAGFVDAGRYVGISADCADGALRLVFSVDDWSLQQGLAYTVVATVDDTAFILPSKAVSGPDGDVLVHRLDAHDRQTVLPALRRGRQVEIATPLGRYTIPLDGSGAALGTLLAACPLAAGGR
ncbi:hypothetical protein [Consotaella aegiceratis]|uniref:hypothetical protein n=1 Tax=Consotaella aegiceratis TaxID=3097961 RepID=UPI002F411512